MNNWELFKNALGVGGGNKEKQTKWMVDVNEMRNQVAHASSGVVLSIEALTKLQGYQEILTRNINAAISVDTSHEEADTDEGFEEA